MSSLLSAFVSMACLGTSQEGFCAEYKHDMTHAPLSGIHSRAPGLRRSVPLSDSWEEEQGHVICKAFSHNAVQSPICALAPEAV